MQLVRLKSDRIIKYAGYEPTRQKLYVGYTKGGCYVFSPVPEHLYSELVASDRPYAFFDSYIQACGFRYARSDVDYMAQLLDAERQQHLKDLAIRETKQATLRAEEAVLRAERQRRVEAEQMTRDYWVRLSGWQFEREVAELFRSHGFHATVTRGSGDGGVDIRLVSRSDAENEMSERCDFGEDGNAFGRPQTPEGTAG